MDRRVRRTRNLLGQALQALITEKSYETITIQDITDRADLNRATFYLHYSSKEELLGDTLEAQFDQLVQRIEEESGGEIYKELSTSAAIVFEHVADHADLYKVLLGANGQGMVMYRILEYIARYDESWLRTAIAEEQLTVPVPILARHFAGSLFSLVTWWLANDMPYSVEYMAEQLESLCMTAVMRPSIDGVLNLTG